MKRILLIFSALFFLGNSVFAALSIEGSYQGKNLIVQNPEDPDGFGYCATKVTVNGNIMPGGIGSSAFEIDFSLFNLKIGQQVFIVIEHNAGCSPKILNPEVLLPKSTFKVIDIIVSASGKLSWRTTDEDGKLPFIIEQYRWNKWVDVGQVQGKGKNSGPNQYDFQVIAHSGQNTVRVVQVDHTGSKRTSKEVKFMSSLPDIKKTPIKVKTEITFTAGEQPIETKYEIYDAYGNIVKKGFGSSVNCSSLVKGAYYINFDNKTEKFFKS